MKYCTQHRNTIKKKYPDLYKTKKIICLHIPDDYDYMDNELKYTLQEKTNNLFGTKG